MKLSVFGGTGGTGRQFVAQALQAGHHLRLLARDPGKLEPWREKVDVVEGNVLNPDDVRRTLEGSEAAVSFLGWSRPNPGDVRSEGTRHIVQGMQERGLRRLIAVTSLGAGDSREQLPPLFRIMVGSVLKGIVADTDEQERIIRGSHLDWTIVRPGRLTDAAPSGTYSYGTHKTLRAGNISRADVADFVLRQLSSEEFIRQAVAVT